MRQLVPEDVPPRGESPLTVGEVEAMLRAGSSADRWPTSLIPRWRSGRLRLQAPGMAGGQSVLGRADNGLAYPGTSCAGGYVPFSPIPTSPFQICARAHRGARRSHHTLKPEDQPTPGSLLTFELLTVSVKMWSLGVCGG